MWRQGTGKGAPGKQRRAQWRGPGIILGAVRGNYFVAMPGSVIKAAPEQLRHRTAEEQETDRVVLRDLRRTANVSRETGSVKNFEDITEQDWPDGDTAEGVEPSQETPEKIVNLLTHEQKDAADPVDLLRCCMRSGEYQLSPEHIILERAAAERSRRKQRQTSSQSSSLQSEPSVSSNAFMVQPGICLKRSEPVNTVYVMVVFPSLGNELHMRSLLESLDSEHASSATSVKVKVPAMLIDTISFEESAATLTLTWSKNTRKVQVQGSHSGLRDSNVIPDFCSRKSSRFLASPCTD